MSVNNEIAIAAEKKLSKKNILSYIQKYVKLLKL
jgi:hypothetical protein